MKSLFRFLDLTIDLIIEFGDVGETLAIYTVSAASNTQPSRFANEWSMAVHVRTYACTYVLHCLCSTMFCM